MTATRGACGTHAPVTTTMRPRHVYHVHRPLVLYVGVSLLVAVGAFHAQNNLLFWLFGISLGLIVVSGIISGWMMMSVRITREAVEPSRARTPECAESMVPEPGTAVRIRYRLTNRSRLLPVFGVTVRELVTEHASGAGERRRARRRAGDLQPTSALAHDREDPRPVQQGALAAAPEVFITHVPPKAEATFEAVTPAVRRGRVHLSGFMLTTTFPFGIIKKSLRFDAPTLLAIRPARHPAPPDLFSGGHGRLHTDQTDLSQAGAGDDFYALREYRPGDSPRHVAWKISARTRGLIVRQTAAASLGSVWLVLLLRPGQPSARQELAIRLASDLAIAGERGGVAIGLIIPEHGVALPPAAGPAALARVLDVLAEIRPPQGEIASPPTRPLPIRPAPGSRYVVVHAGSVDPRILPGALHLSADGEVDAGSPAQPRRGTVAPVPPSAPVTAAQTEGRP
jgi:hypothetical protein